MTHVLEINPFLIFSRKGWGILVCKKIHMETTLNSSWIDHPLPNTAKCDEMGCRVEDRGYQIAGCQTQLWFEVRFLIVVFFTLIKKFFFSESVSTFLSHTSAPTTSHVLGKWTTSRLSLSPLKMRKYLARNEWVKEFSR